MFDKNMKRVGEIDEWLSLDFTVRLRHVGHWQLLIKDGTPQSRLIEKGGGIVIWQEGVTDPLLSGQVETYQKYWTKLQHTGPGSLYIAGECHNGLTTRRLALPSPTRGISQQYQGPSAYTVKQSAGGAAWDLVSANLGSSAVADRRMSKISFGTKPVGVGAEIKDSLRYDPISSKLEEWCEAKRIGYRMIYNANTQSIDFKVFPFRDLSKRVRFSAELGNLREVIWTLSAPKLTRAIVGCQGEGKQRFVWQKVDSSAEAEWGLSIETFIDRRDVPLRAGKTGGAELVTTILENGWEDIGTNPDGGEWTQELANAKKAYADAVAAGDPDTDPEYDAVVYAIKDAKVIATDYYMNVVEEAAASALTEGQRKGNFQIYPIDTPDCQFGKHYFVGDLVTVAVDGTEYTDVVREVVVSVDDAGNVQDVSPKVGEQGTGEPLNLYKTVSEMQRKLRRLESRM
ncbi:hypothetical protein [Streptomyces sp. NPDC057854]|uniref:Gp37-like protein n=1 Tax=unclassified Streptomyces TaxID=2593676 RepID=UPI00367699B6